MINIDKWLLALLLASVAIILTTPFFYSLLSKLSTSLASPIGYPTSLGILLIYILLIIIFRLSFV